MTLLIYALLYVDFGGSKRPSLFNKIACLDDEDWNNSTAPSSAIPLCTTIGNSHIGFSGSLNFLYPTNDHSQSHHVKLMYMFHLISICQIKPNVRCMILCVVFSRLWCDIVASENVVSLTNYFSSDG